MRQVIAQEKNEWESWWICVKCPDHTPLEKQTETVQENEMLLAVWQCPVCGYKEYDPVKDLRDDKLG